MKKYHFVETQKVDGKTCRIAGSTRVSIRSLKHLPKIGVPQYVYGYVYRGRHGVLYPAVKVVGDKGSIRFGGFSWGYSGQGPNGLQQLFNLLGVKENPATMTNWPTKFTERTYWKIPLNRPVNLLCQ